MDFTPEMLTFEVNNDLTGYPYHSSQNIWVESHKDKENDTSFFSYSQFIVSVDVIHIH